jgi:hypothetical protein
MSDERFTAPHCDQSVLHAPGECRYCDAHPDWQAYRKVAGIAFTGREPAALYPGGPLEAPCPSDLRRGRGQAHTWGGNRPTHVSVPQEETFASRVMYANPVRTEPAHAARRQPSPLERLAGSIRFALRWVWHG